MSTTSEAFVAAGHVTQDAGREGVVGLVGKCCATRNSALTGAHLKLIALQINAFMHDCSSRAAVTLLPVCVPCMFRTTLIV